MNMRMKLLYTLALSAGAVACLAAEEAADGESFLREHICLLNELSCMLEELTPDSAEACLTELDAVQERMRELAARGKRFSADDLERAMQPAAMRTAMEEALRRFYRAVLHLAMKAPIEDDAPLRRVLLKLQTLPPAPQKAPCPSRTDE